MLYTTQKITPLFWRELIISQRQLQQESGRLFGIDTKSPCFFIRNSIYS